MQKDWDWIDYHKEELKEVEKEWRIQVAKTQTDEYLLDTFPEAKEIIPRKIDKHKADRHYLIEKMRSFRKEIKKIAPRKSKDEFFVWFWAFAYLKYFHASKIVAIDKRLFRLKRQLRIIQGNNLTNNAMSNFAELKERAKQQPLINIATPYLKKARYGSVRITALCPFHEEKTPSFTIYIDKNTFHCFGCQAHGDVITFKMKIDNLSFKDAVKGIAL